MQPNAFVTYFRRDETDEGARNSNVLFYLRTLEEPYGKSIIAKPQSIRHVVPTNFIGKTREQKFREALQSYQESFAEHDIQISNPMPIGNNYVIYHADCPHLPEKTMQGILPKEFITSTRNRVTQMVGWRIGYPFQLCNYDSDTGKLVFTGGKVSSEKLIGEKTAAIDIETKNWQRVQLEERILALSDSKLQNYFKRLVDAKNVEFDFDQTKHWKRKHYVRAIEAVVRESRKEDITSAVYATGNRGPNAIFTTLDGGMKKVPVQIPGSSEKIDFDIYLFPNSGELVKALNETYQKDDPFWTTGHNQLKFDYDKLHTLTEEDFLPGVGETKAKYESRAGGDFIIRRIIPGRLDIDPSGFSQNYSWTFNNKLDTCLKYFVGVDSPKDVTHEEGILLTAEAENGNKEAALRMIEYNGTDGLKSLLIAEKLKAEHIALGIQHASSPARIDTTAKRTLAEESDSRRYFKRVKTFPKQIPFSEQTAWNAFSSRDVTYKTIDISIPGESSWLKSQRGMFDSSIVYLSPIVYALQEALHADSREVRKVISESSDKKQKIRLMQSLDYDLEMLLYELQRHTDFKSLITKEVDSKTDFIFRQRFDIQRNDAIKRLSNSVTQAGTEIFNSLNPHPVVNFSDRFFAIREENGLEEKLQELERKGLLVVLGNGRTMSGQQGSFISFIDGAIISQGIDPMGRKGERCLFERKNYEEFIKHALVEDNPYSALKYVSERAKQLAEKNVDETELMFEREAKRNWTDYSSRATNAFIKVMIEKEIEAGERFSYSYDLNTLQDKFYGNDKKTGSIRNLVLCRFPITRGSISKRLDNIFKGKGTDGDIEAVINGTEQKLNKDQLDLF